MTFLAFCQRSLRTNAKYCLKLTNLQKAVTERCLVARRIHLAQICAGYATKVPPGFDHKNEILPYPNIEGIRFFDAEYMREHNFKQVKYGDYVFKECAEGFVHVYVCGYHNPDAFGVAGYGVCFGVNHPLNASGLVERRQKLIHANLYGFLKAISLIPKDLKIQKLCVCVNATVMIGFICKSIPTLNENAFRTESGRLTKDLETTMEINNLLRSRQDIIRLRIRYIPTLIRYNEMHQAKKMATKAVLGRLYG